jgi:hypothetical protein
VFLLETFFRATNSDKIWSPLVPLEITVRNKISARIIPMGTSILTVFFQEKLEKLYFFNHLLGKWLPVALRAIK